MASLCPQCGNSIEQDFGVATCSQCQAVLFIDMDGNINASAEAESDPSLQEIIPPESDFQSDENNWMSSENHSLAAGSELQESAPQEPAIEQETDQQFDPQSEFVSSEIQSSHNGFEAPALEDPPTNDFNDVSDYANSDQALGSLVYSVLIENIDTKETRALLVEALADSKFQWDAKELLKQVKMGKLKLENLNPVKASVLVFRLQDLPVKVSWVQNAYA